MDIMMATPLVPMVLSGEKTQTRRTGKRWLKVKVGDVLAMREAFWCSGGESLETHDLRYKADCDAEEREFMHSQEMRWTPAIHMPLHFVRAELVVKRVWQERAGDISEADAIAEGMDGLSVGGCSNWRVGRGAW